MVQLTSCTLREVENLPNRSQSVCARGVVVSIPLEPELYGRALSAPLLKATDNNEAIDWGGDPFTTLSRDVLLAERVVLQWLIQWVGGASGRCISSINGGLPTTFATAAAVATCHTTRSDRLPCDGAAACRVGSMHEQKFRKSSAFRCVQFQCRAISADWV